MVLLTYCNFDFFTNLGFIKDLGSSLPAALLSPPVGRTEPCHGSWCDRCACWRLELGDNCHLTQPSMVTGPGVWMSILGHVMQLWLLSLLCDTDFPEDLEILLKRRGATVLSLMVGAIKHRHQSLAWWHGFATLSAVELLEPLSDAVRCDPCLLVTFFVASCRGQWSCHTATDVSNVRCLDSGPYRANVQGFLAHCHAARSSCGSHF